MTLGNHSFDQREALVFIARQPRLIRPLNYPAGTPGAGTALVETAGGARVLVVNAMGRIFMDAMDDPFATIDRELDACPLGRVCDAAIVDFHAEATSEKMAFGHHCDGRASLVVGTHTHVPTADAQILPGGTAYLSDAGMTGDYDSVIGMDKQEPVRRMIRKTPGAPLRAGQRPGDAVRRCGGDRRLGQGDDGGAGADRGPARGGAAGLGVSSCHSGARDSVNPEPIALADGGLCSVDDPSSSSLRLRHNLPESARRTGPHLIGAETRPIVGAGDPP